MAKKLSAGILRHHLEYLSGEVFEEYPEVVRELIRGRSGVYALYRGVRLYYVGLATNLMTRVKHHFKDRHQRRWDHFSVYLTDDSDHMRELESLLLRIANPPGNQIVGRLGKSGDLHDDFERRAQELEATRLSRLLGTGRGSKGHKVSKGPKSSKGAAPASRGSATGGKVFVLLRRTYKGKAFKAYLRADGTVKLGHKVYSSPSGAACAVVGRTANGWTFWKRLDESRNWVPLDSLRKKGKAKAK